MGGLEQEGGGVAKNKREGVWVWLIMRGCG